MVMKMDRVPVRLKSSLLDYGKVDKFHHSIYNILYMVCVDKHCSTIRQWWDLRG